MVPAGIGVTMVGISTVSVVAVMVVKTVPSGSVMTSPKYCLDIGIIYYAFNERICSQSVRSSSRATMGGGSCHGPMGGGLGIEFKQFCTCTLLAGTILASTKFFSCVVSLG